MNCHACRAEMCTEGLLSKLRCAECRQIKFEQICDATLKVALITLSGVFVWFLVSRLDEAHRARSWVTKTH
jgi:prophage antirepressor-like protein